MSKSSLMAIDLGKQSAGLAFSPDGQVALSSGQLSFSSETELMEKLAKKAKAKGVEKVVFGLPLDQKGHSTKQSAWVKRVAKRFNQESQISIDFNDEYLTTWQAKEKIKREDQEESLDQEAARIILEEYLKND